MTTARIKKKRVDEINPVLLTEPQLTFAEWEEFERGETLFNERKFWEAHEAWENVWKERPEESRIFFQGIIQAAAGYHLLIVKHRLTGAINNFNKALSKLALFPNDFLEINVHELRTAITESKTIALRLGPEGLSKFPVTSVPFVGKSLE